MGPDLGQIKDVVTEMLCLFRSHGLDIDSPRWVFTLLNSIEHLLSAVVRVLSREAGGCLVIESLEATIGTAVDLYVYEGAISLAPLESVARISVLVEDAIRSSTVREEDHHLVDRLWVLGEVIPEHSGVLEMCLRVPLLGVDEVREFGRVTYEEDGSVVKDPIPITFLGPELDGETARVTSSVGGPRFTTDGGETGGDANLLPGTLEEGLRGNVTQVMGDFKISVGTSTFGVDDTLWDTLAIEVSEEIDVMEILEEERPVEASPLS